MATTLALKVVPKEGVQVMWAHVRKLDKVLREEGVRLATQEDLASGSIDNAVMMVLVAKDAPVEVKKEDVVRSDKRPSNLKHVEGFTISWCEAAKVPARLAKGYHVVAQNELVGDTTGSIDAVVHNGHILTAKPKGVK